jgi:hypothetical protein
MHVLLSIAVTISSFAVPLTLATFSKASGYFSPATFSLSKEVAMISDAEFGTWFWTRDSAKLKFAAIRFFSSSVRMLLD